MKVLVGVVRFSGGQTLKQLLFANIARKDGQP